MSFINGDYFSVDDGNAVVYKRSQIKRLSKYIPDIYTSDRKRKSEKTDEDTLKASGYVLRHTGKWGLIYKPWNSPK